MDFPEVGTLTLFDVLDGWMNVHDVHDDQFNICSKKKHENQTLVFRFHELS